MSEQLFDVIAVDMKTGLADAMMGKSKTARNAEAIEAMAVMQRGLDTHFYVTVPTGTLLEGQKYEVPVCKS